MLLFSTQRNPNFYAVRRAGFFALVLALTGILGACGFRPLYGQNERQSLTAEQSLSQIEIQPIKDRIGQQLRNNLLSRLNPKQRTEKPLYALSVSLTESVANLGVKKSAVVTRGNLRITANYTLSFLSGAAPKEDEAAQLASGTVLSTSSYDIPQAQFAALAALKDARARAIKEIADDIRTRLAVYFRQNADNL